MEHGWGLDTSQQSIFERWSLCETQTCLCNFCDQEKLRNDPKYYFFLNQNKREIKIEVSERHRQGKKQTNVSQGLH